MTARPTAPPSPSTPAGQSLGAMPCYASSCGRVTLYLGDCLDIMPTLGRVDAVVSDPPYGIAWVTDYKFKRDNGVTRANKMTRKQHKPIQSDETPFDPSHLLTGKPTVLFGANHYMDKLPKGGLLIWDKRRPDGTFFMSPAEIAWSNTSRAVAIKEYCWQGFARAGENSQHFHPTQKPVVIMAWTMEEAKVPEGATVLDPYMGSGTTGIACIRTGRRFVGIEKDPTHYATAVERIRREIEGDLFHSQHNKLL